MGAKYLADANCKVLQMAVKRKAEHHIPNVDIEAQQQLQRAGPCHFGHNFTTAAHKGHPYWTATPLPSFWYDVTPGVSLCQKCYTRGRAAMIRNGGQTAANPRNAASSADDGPPTKARRIHASTTAAAGAAPDYQAARSRRSCCHGETSRSCWRCLCSACRLRCAATWTACAAHFPACAACAFCHYFYYFYFQLPLPRSFRAAILGQWLRQ